MDANGDRRVVLVHDWLTGMRGGEKCLEVFRRRWPRAPLFTLLHRPGSVVPILERPPLHTSWLQALPRIWRYYRFALPVMPLAVRTWRLPECDLVVSCSHCVAKAALVPPGVPHVCYCLTPMRYAWHLREAYLGAGYRGRAISWILDALREWDRRTAQQVTHFIAISRTVQRRIGECYGRSSTVIYPPVDTDFYCPAPVQREHYYLVVSAFAPYKRLDLAVEACNRLRRRLVIIGTGQDERRIRAMAGPTVELLGWQPEAVIRHHLRRCRALLFPGEEDFGIVPVEAQACGAPVIAFGQGGATETVLPPERGSPPTGMWFEDQTAESLIAVIESFEAGAWTFDPSAARSHALRFGEDQFRKEIFGYVEVLFKPAPAHAGVRSRGPGQAA
jgi:glycosyltransferase involved in cell wall biosynthesis